MKAIFLGIALLAIGGAAPPPSGAEFTASRRQTRRRSMPVGARSSPVRRIGPDHETTVLRSSENSKKDFKGHVEYNYSCRVKVQWNPIYNVRTDPLCGVAPN